MTNPTYTDEQVLKCANTYEGYGEPVCPAMLRSLLADRQRLQADEAKNAHKAQQIVLDIWKAWYFGAPEWTPADNTFDLLGQIFNSLWGLPAFSRSVDARLTAQKQQRINASRATPNETKEAKS